MELVASMMELNILLERLCCCQLLDKALFIIEANKNCTAKNLLEKLEIQKSNLALLMKSLKSKKYVEQKQSDAYLHAICYCITPKGEKYLKDKCKCVYEKLSNNLELNNLKNICENLNKNIK